jgi:hypothetical protein
MSTQKSVLIARLNQLELGPAAAIEGSTIEHALPIAVYSSASQ